MTVWLCKPTQINFSFHKMTISTKTVTVPTFIDKLVTTCQLTDKQLYCRLSTTERIDNNVTSEPEIGLSSADQLFPFWSALNCHKLVAERTPCSTALYFSRYFCSIFSEFYFNKQTSKQIDNILYCGFIELNKMIKLREIVYTIFIR